MPHALTRTRAVVDGGILAVLLLACLSAPVGAQTPAPRIPNLALAITHDELGTRVFQDGDLVVTSNLAAADPALLPASVTGGGALLNSSPECRSHSGGGDGYDWHSDIGKGRYKHCDSACDDVYHVIFISKRNEAGGNTDSFSWYTTESR